jgi:hypothetical protein
MKRKYLSPLTGDKGAGAECVCEKQSMTQVMPVSNCD